MTLPSAERRDAHSSSVLSNSEGHAAVSVVRRPAADVPPAARNSSAEPTKGDNAVSALVAKSKKAAASLFTLLHAKVRDYSSIVH